MTAVTRVPLLDLTRMDDDLREELRQAFGSVLESGRYIMGPEVEALERECADYLGVRHAIGVSSGTDALLASFMALGIGPGDEVVCPTYTFFATAGSIRRTGARPVFVDCDPRTYQWDEAALEGAITERTRALVPVHLFGQAAPLRRALELARERGVAIVEDAAQAIGVACGGRKAGAWGDYGCFSFFPSKNLGALGDGGLVTTADDELAEKLRVMRAHGGKPKYHHAVVGGNFRLDALQAALLRVKLRRLEEAHQRRRANAALYRDLLCQADVVTEEVAEGLPPGRLGLPVEAPESIYNQFVVRVGGGARDALRAFLAEHGVGTEVYYPIPMHLQRCFAELGYREGDFPHAEAAARETLALPIFPELTREEISYVVDRIVRFCRGRLGGTR